MKSINWYLSAILTSIVEKKGINDIKERAVIITEFKKRQDNFQTFDR